MATYLYNPPRAEADHLITALKDSQGALLLETTINDRTNYIIYEDNDYGWSVLGPDEHYELTEQDVRDQIWDGRIWHIAHIAENVE